MRAVLGPTVLDADNLATWPPAPFFKFLGFLHPAHLPGLGVCPGFGWDRVNFLPSSCCFGFSRR